MKTSIAMATYNGAKYLQEQLDSFTIQTLHPDELVVCDDCSTDATLSILENFRMQAPFVVKIYCNEKNLGFIKNFEKALSLCTGEIIFLSDQDDVWHSEKIAVMNNHLQHNSNIFVLQADMFLGNEDAKPTNYTQLKNIVALGHGFIGYFTGCGMAIRKEWLDIALPIPEKLLSHDNWIHRLAVAINVRDLHTTPLQCYRRHESNSSNWLASKPGNISLLDSYRRHGLKDASLGWENELRRVQETHNRLLERMDIINTLGIGKKLPKALEHLNYHIIALKSRIKNSSRPRQLRVFYTIQMWFRGDYKYFSGWKSFTKDIIRTK